MQNRNVIGPGPRFFGETERGRKTKSPAKRFRRPYTILLIPTAIVERELRKLAT